jgi:hypothetical protein
LFTDWRGSIELTYQRLQSDYLKLHKEDNKVERVSLIFMVEIVMDFLLILVEATETILNYLTGAILDEI